MPLPKYAVFCEDKYERSLDRIYPTPEQARDYVRTMADLGLASFLVVRKVASEEEAKRLQFHRSEDSYDDTQDRAYEDAFYRWSTDGGPSHLR